MEVFFSVGFDLTEPAREAILATPESAWVTALKQDGEERPWGAVCELVDLDLAGWPSGTRAICRRERPHPGAQLSFTDHNGYGFQCFITDQTHRDLASLEVRLRAHARVEDPIRCAKETGLENSPSGASPPTKFGWSWCSPPPGPALLALQAEALVEDQQDLGAQETPLSTPAHRGPHDQNWPPPHRAPAMQVALDGRPAGCLRLMV